MAEAAFLRSFGEPSTSHGGPGGPLSWSHFVGGRGKCARGHAGESPSNCQRPAVAERVGPTRRSRFRDRSRSQRLLQCISFVRLDGRRLKERGRHCEVQVAPSTTSTLLYAIRKSAKFEQTQSRRGSHGLALPALFGVSPSRELVRKNPAKIERSSLFHSPLRCVWQSWGEFSSHFDSKLPQISACICHRTTFESLPADACSRVLLICAAGLCCTSVRRQFISEPLAGLVVSPKS